MAPYKLRFSCLLALALMAGCASAPPADRNAEIRHCYQSKVDRYRKGPCTSAPVPSLEADADAKRFRPEPAAFTVYVVRHSWGDGFNLLNVHLDERSGIETVPDSMVRLRLPPGSHTLAFEFEGRRHSLSMQGAAGELRFVRLGGTAWAWSSSYAWVEEPQQRTRERAARTRLVADVDLAPMRLR